MIKRKFKLGESHFIPWEFIEDGVWWYYPHIGDKEIHIFNVLSEAYIKTDTTQIENILIQISEALQNYNIEDVKDLTIGDFKIFIKDGDYVQSAIYNSLTKGFNFIINKKCLQHIKNFENTRNITKAIKSLFVHEDTHKQQDIKSNGKFYNSEIYINANNEDDKKKYINQRVEIDAWARQCGFDLKDLYPEESMDDIFKRIFSLNIEDERVKNNLIYLFDNLTSKNQHFFLRNMYDYINGEENWE